jgi:hypothetical protein
MSFSGMLRSVALVRTDISEELSASIIRVTKIGELGTTLAVNVVRPLSSGDLPRRCRRCLHGLGDRLCDLVVRVPGC